MGNIGSTTNQNHHQRRPITHHHHHHHPPPPSPQQPQSTSNRYVFAAATPYPNAAPPPHPPYYNYPGYYPAPPPAMPLPFPATYDQPHRYPFGRVLPAPAPYVEHQKAVTIRNDVNLKKETLMIVPDKENHGKFLVSFMFDATVSGSISIVFFAKEGEDCSLTPVKETILPPFTMQFPKGLAQKFIQPSGTGIDLSMFEEAELVKAGETGVYPLAVKAEASPDNDDGDLPGTGHQQAGSTNIQITQVVFEKEKGAYKVRVMKQILFVNGMRYELQEIYGIGNSVDNDFDGNDPGKECVICLTEPRDTTVLPCRHMCMCSECASVLRSQTNRCPICRQPVERLLEIKVHNNNNNGTGE